MGSFRNMLSVFLLAVNCLSCAAMAGEQAKSKPNFGLLMLFNCSPNSSLTLYSTHSGRGYSRVLSVDERNYGGTVVFDMMKVLNCSNYKWMHSSFVDENGFMRRMALDVLEIQNICDCKEPGARDYGPGLRCMCNPKECKEKRLWVIHATSAGSLMDNAGLHSDASATPKNARTSLFLIYATSARSRMDNAGRH
ncbi:hypothetical protein SAY87_019519 [Trapa incisa]|uniref:Uncharacterized protein n=1 Tax=Trapa incisa TaxID=236973 RepID=A0AAN7JZD9_9MYRT|nr:hypothetical protein SAY87_019519 [Trapa incisa]